MKLVSSFKIGIDKDAFRDDVTLPGIDHVINHDGEQHFEAVVESYASGHHVLDLEYAGNADKPYYRIAYAYLHNPSMPIIDVDHKDVDWQAYLAVFSDLNDAVMYFDGLVTQMRENRKGWAY